MTNVGTLRRTYFVPVSLILLTVDAGGAGFFGDKVARSPGKKSR
jgi:hypothetical protein